MGAKLRVLVLLTLVGGLIAGALVQPAAAQEQPEFVETHLYFGLDAADGHHVTDAEWSNFVAEVITPRFPGGLTILSASGQSTPEETGELIREDVRILIVVHHPTEADEKRFEEIKHEYKSRFDAGGLFHTRAPVEVVSGIDGQD